MNNPKYYTAFLFHKKLASRHCTHKYLGALDASELFAAIACINTFDPTEYEAPVAVFDKEENFGTEEKPLRVLVTPAKAAFDGFAPLRNLLDAIKLDDFPYTPHVTTDSGAAIDLPLTHYGLCVGQTVLFAWPMKGKQ